MISSQQPLSKHIADDVAQRLTQGEELKLNLRALAKEYGTSVQPVIRAMDELVEAGVLQKSSAGRLSLNKSHSSLGLKKTLSPPQQEGSALEKFSSELLRKSLKGQSLWVRENEGEKFGLGRTAFRRVLDELARKGLLIHEERKGFRLRHFEKKDFDDFLEIRALLEVKALQLAWKSLDLERIQTFLDQNAIDQRGRTHIDNDFHAYFITLADNRYIREFLDTHAKFFELFFHYEAKDKNMQHKTVQQHRDILEAILANQPKKACKALEHHIRNNHELLLAEITT